LRDFLTKELQPTRLTPEEYLQVVDLIASMTATEHHLLAYAYKGDIPTLYKKSLFFLHKVEGDIVAFQRVTLNPSKLEELYVAPAARHLGIGGSLLDKAINVLPKPISMKVKTNNAAMLKLALEKAFKPERPVRGVVTLILS